MIRSILVALDDTPGAQNARDLTFAIARRTGAAVTATTVLDTPHARDEHEAVPPGAAAFKERRDAARAKRLEEEAEAAFAACAAAAGETPFARLRLIEAPGPALIAAGAAHDLVAIGRDATLGLQQSQGGMAPVIGTLLQEGARPLLVVPPGPMPPEGRVLVAYDGSVPSMRALQLFALLGLAGGAEVRVISIAGQRAEAVPLAEAAAGYLQAHGVSAEPVALESEHPAEMLIAEMTAMRAGLFVMGSYEHSGLRTFFTRSTTRGLLLAAPCPVFVAH